MLLLAPGEIDVDQHFAELVLAVADDRALVIEVEIDIRISVCSYSAKMLIDDNYARAVSADGDIDAGTAAPAAP